MARRRKSSPFSLFSFQDIITSVTGIIILLTLMLALELITRDPTAKSSGAAESVSQLDQSIREAEAEVARLEELLKRGTDMAEELAAASPQQLNRAKQEVEREIVRLEAELVELDHKERAKRRDQEEAESQNKDRQKDRDTLKQLESTAQVLVDKLKDLKEKNRLIYNPSRDTGKQAWLVDVAPDKISVACLGRAAASTLFEQSSSSARVRAFLEFINKREPSSDYFVLLVRPAATEVFDELRTKLEKRGFELGFDLIGAQQTVIDPAAGTSLP